MEETASLARSCPACGAAMPQQARFCGACGADTQSSMQSSPEQRPAASETPVLAESQAAPAMTPAASAAAPTAHGGPEPTRAASTADGRACPWCGAINPRDAARCVVCDAVFPTPEGDAALERAAQERISAMEGALRQRRGWWPFRSR